VLDDVWHLMMLRPRVYAAVCSAFGVGLIDHVPRLAEDREERNTRRRACCAAYRVTYGSLPPYLWKEGSDPETEEVAEEPAPKRSRGAARTRDQPLFGPAPDYATHFTLADYDIEENSIINIVLKLRGC